jgi:DNA helicase-2/ATP-dependent DNA helicase PcrA
MVVLARNRLVFAPLQQQLDAAGIDYHLRQTSGGVAFESEAGKILDLAVRLAINPLNSLIFNQLCRAIGVSNHGLSSEPEGLAILRSVFDQASSEWRSWLEPLIPFIESLHADINTFSAAHGKLEADWQQASAMLPKEKEAGEQALGDLRYLKEVWRNYATNVAKDNRTLAQFRNQMSTGEILPHMTGKGLTLAPVHTVKGLEFEIVFLIGMVEGTFPDYRAVKSGDLALREEKNDAFVAITRAKRLLYLTWPEQKFMPWDPERRVRQRRSRYLDDIGRRIPPTCHLKIAAPSG